MFLLQKQYMFLVETTEQKSEVQIMPLSSTSRDENFPCYLHTGKVACLLSVLTPLSILLEWPVLITEWTQQTSSVMRQTAH